MKKIIGCTLLAVFALASVPAFAASTSDFYMTLLRRGTSEVDAGRYDTAVTPLRIAAFGLIESIDQYEIAQTYLAVAFDKLEQPDDAREAAQRVVAAERVERKFGSLALPESIRTAFTAVARKVLGPGEVTSLTAPPKGGTSPASPPPAISARPTPSTTKPATATTTAAAQPPASKPAPATTTPATSTTAAAKPVIPPATKPAPVTATPSTAKPAATNTATTTKPAPATTAPAPAPQPAKIDIAAKLNAGDKALASANLAEARRAYREVLDAPGVDHATYIRIGEGFYRARDFANALTAFQRAGTFRNGEEAYHYYIAVCAYETGDYERAKRELNAALPHIEITDDVQRYRTKIEGSR